MFFCVLAVIGGSSWQRANAECTDCGRSIALNEPTEAQSIVADYRHTGLTLGKHPLSLLRDQLTAMRLMSSAVLNGYEDGRLARGCGIVTFRQDG